MDAASQASTERSPDAASERDGKVMRRFSQVSTEALHNASRSRQPALSGRKHGCPGGAALGVGWLRGSTMGASATGARAFYGILPDIEQSSGRRRIGGEARPRPSVSKNSNSDPIRCKLRIRGGELPVPSRVIIGVRRLLVPCGGTGEGAGAGTSGHGTRD